MLASFSSVPRHPQVAVAVSLALLLLAWPGTSWSSPVEDTTLDGSIFTGPTHAHPTSIWINPAAMGTGGFQKYIYVGGSARFDDYDITRERVTDESGATTTDPQVSDYTFEPGGLAVLHVKTGRSATLGIAVGMPMYERFLPDQQSLGYHTLGGEHWQWALTLATSIKLNRRLYFGASLSRVSTRLGLSFYRDTALERGTTGLQEQCGTALCGIENPMAAERWDIEVDSDGIFGAQTVSIRAGMVYQFARDWWFGASYHSPPGLRAPLTLTGSVHITPAEIDDATERAEANAELVYQLPSTIHLGVRGPIYRDLQLVLGFRWQNLSQQRTFDLRVFGRNLPTGTPEWYPRHRGLRDTYQIEAGVEGPLLNWLTGGVRLRVERGATTSSSISPMQMEGLNLGAALGAEARIADKLIIAATYIGSFYPTVNSDNSEYNPLDRISCINSDYDIDTCTSSAEGRAISSAAGTYSHLSHAFRVSLRYSWD